jgi:hypothetical protein
VRSASSFSTGQDECGYLSGGLASRIVTYLGHTVSRDEVRLGPKAKQRLRGRLAEHAKEPDRAAASALARVAGCRSPSNVIPIEVDTMRCA